MASPNYKKILKNNTNPAVELDLDQQLGITIPAGGQRELEPGRYYVPAEVIGETGAGTLNQYILDGDIVVNDGVNDLSPDRGIDYLKHPDRAFNIRFESEPQRSNNFASKNVQEAIEEAKSAIEGKISVLPTFLNNGVTKNKWLSLDGSFSSSDILPAISTFNSKFAGITYVNSNNNSSVDIEFYKNGTGPGDLIYTWLIRNKRYAYITDVPLVTFAAGDRISCFAKAVSGGGIIDPNSVIVNLFVQSTDSLVGEGGGITL